MRFASLLAAILAFHSPPSLAAEPQRSVEDAMAGFLDALNALDWPRFSAYFADDASLFNPDIPEALYLERLDGREKIERSFHSVFGAAGLRSERPPIVPQDVRVQQLGATAAIVTFRFDRGGGSFGRRTFVFQRRSGEWKVVHIHASNVRPHEAAVRVQDCPSGSTAKGVEIYSWRTPEGRWMFSMLHGTNREKYEAEVRRSGCLLTADELEKALARLAKGEYVMWLDRAGWDLAFPPPDMLDRLRLVAEAAGLNFSVAGVRKSHD